MKKMFVMAAALAALAVSAGNLTDKISEKCTILGTDTFHGFNRTKFTFGGCTAWVVEPSIPALKAMPWTWTMQWATAYVPRTPVLQLLRQGWHHVTIDTFKYKMNDEGLAVSKAFQEYLTGELGFAPKSCLIGMSWGGFFSTRYAAANPDKVAAIYYDCPLMNFDNMLSKPAEEVKDTIFPWVASSGKWADDPRMPINMAETLAKAGIPVYLVYGGADRTVPPEVNCEVFVPRFKAAGGKIKVDRRYAYGHHPHGLEIDDPAIADFFRSAACPAGR